MKESLTIIRLRNKVKKLEALLKEINDNTNISFSAPDLILYRIEKIKKLSTIKTK